VAQHSLWEGPVIDVDVHAVTTRDLLLPYLDEFWHQFIRDRGWVGPPGAIVTYPSRAPSTARPEWRPEDGRPAGSDVGLLKGHVLDPWSVDAAIVNCYYGIDSIRHPDLARAITRATNDWLIGERLDRDPRLRASIVVPARYPDMIVEEIERVGAHPGFVQVLVPVRCGRLYGQRVWHPRI